MTLRELELKIAAGTATEADFAAFTIDDVLRIKSELPMQQRAVLVPSVNDIVDVGAIVVPADPAQRVIELVANAQLVDRMGDLIVSNPTDAEKFGGTGWELTHFMAAGGPYLWSHDPDCPAVGKVVGTAIKRVPCDVEGEGEQRAWALVCSVQFFADAKFGELAIPAYMLTRAGITASSVGFLPKVFHRIDDEKERAKWGLGPWGAVLPRNELLELSKAQVPANPWSVGTGKSVVVDVEKHTLQALKRWVAEGKLPESLAGDFVKQFPIGQREAAERLAARVRGFMPQAAAARGKPCVGLECLALPAGEAPLLKVRTVDEVRGLVLLEDRDTGRVYDMSPEALRLIAKSAEAVIGKLRGETPAHDCGCGAKTLEQKLAAAEAELASLRAARAAGDEQDVPARSMRRIRRALDRASEAVEELAIVVDDEAGEDDGGQKATNSPLQLAEVPPSMATDLRKALADPRLSKLVANLLRALVEVPLGGGNAPPKAAVARDGAAGPDAGPTLAALRSFQQEVSTAAS